MIEPGKVFFMDDASAPRNFLRIGFTSIRLEQIDPGIARLAEVVRRYRMRAAAEGPARRPRLHNISSRR